jgi:DNA polymerase-3 subunit delta
MPTPSDPVPVTLVLGEEELLAERAVAAAVRAAVDALGPDTTVQEVRGGNLPEGFALDLGSASLFGGGRVVVVQEADGLDAQGRAAVLAAARDPGPGTVLVVRAATPGRQAKFFKELQAHASVVLVGRLKPSERARWIRGELRRLGRRADDAAIAALLDTVGQDLRELAGAVAKLNVAVPPPAVITADHASRFLAQTAERGVFDLTDAVFAGDAATALAHLDSLLVQGEDPIGLLGMLARQLRLLVRVSDQAGVPAAEVATQLGGGTRDWQVERARRQARKFRPGDLRHGLEVIAEADARIRNGDLPGRLVIELVVARLAGAAAPR